MNNQPIEQQLEKVAENLQNVEMLASDEVLTKVAFANSLYKKIDSNFEKTAAAGIPNPTNAGASTVNRVRNGLSGVMGRTGRNLAGALVAGIGLGIAGEAIGYGHKKIKEMMFDKKLDKMTKEVKKINPSLKDASDNEIKQMLRAGYQLAPNIMDNPIVGASFVSIGKSLGGQVDPNTIKLFADANAKGGFGPDSSISGLLTPGINLTR